MEGILIFLPDKHFFGLLPYSDISQVADNGRHEMIIRAITRLNKKGNEEKYTVYMWDGSCLVINCDSDCPQGKSQWSEYFGINDADFETGVVGGDKMINWFDLPVVLQAHIEKRVREGQK